MIKKYWKATAFSAMLGGLFVFWKGSFFPDKQIAMISILMGFGCLLGMMSMIAESIEKDLD